MVLSRLSILSPVAGVWADRYNRKILIIVSDGLIAMSTLILAIVFLMGYDAIWLLFVMAAIRAIGAGIQDPGCRGDIAANCSRG